MTNHTQPMSRQRVIAACAAFFAASISALAQTTPAAKNTADNEETVALSRFEVLTTQDTGYVANNTATGFKTNEQLMKIPQSVTVVTRDMINDIGATKTSDVLQFAGASQFYRGESIRLRGARTLNAYIDDSIDNTPYMDNVYIDSYEIIRGPAGVLYANAGLAGAVLKTTKKPLPYKLDTARFSLNDWGLYRVEFDTTGPIGSVGGAKLSYRVTGAYQDGDAYFKNVKDKHTAIHPSFQVDFKNTTVRFAVDYQDLKSISGAQNFVTPDGKLYTGAGRDEAYYAPNAMESFKSLHQRVQVLHRFSENWEAKMSMMHNGFERKGGVVIPFDGVNFVTNTYNMGARRNYQKFNNWILNQDFLGKYTIAGMENQSALGFTWTDEINRAAFTRSTAFGSNPRPIANPQMNSVVAPTFDSYESQSPLSSSGSWTNNKRTTYYYQHTATVIPNRLILVGGITYGGLQIDDVPAVSAKASAGGTRIVSFSEWLHRVGIVLNITKEIAVYALDSTTFAPQGNSNTRDINGVLLPAQKGEGQEIGVKTALFGGKLSATISAFDMELSNVGVLQGTISPITGANYFRNDGLQTQKGWDSSISYAPIPEWQILVTAYKGTVKDQTGATANNTYSSLYSFFTRYEFLDGAAKGFSIGGGGSKTGGNIFTSLGGYVFPAGVTPGPVTLESVWNTNLFFSYRYGKHWTFRLNVENVLDKSFALGAQSLTFVDPSPPRTFTLSTIYRF